MRFDIREGFGDVDSSAVEVDSAPSQPEEFAQSKAAKPGDEHEGEERIGRSRAYAYAHEYINSGGTAGMPVIVFGPGCFRVPRCAPPGSAAGSAPTSVDSWVESSQAA